MVLVERISAMQTFVSTFEMRTDVKGRVSIPKAYREVLRADGFEGLYCIPSPDGQSIDAGGSKLMGMLDAKLAALDPTSFDYDLLATAFFGESEILSVEKEGRISLSPRLKSLAGIERELIFVGKGYKFQIWSPERYARYREKAIEQARRVLWGDQSGATLAAQGSGGEDRS
ncbi:MAG: division/cell wall cluster transcriptional repressor MraZ [Pseudomonadota bacterium]